MLTHYGATTSEREGSPAIVDVRGVTIVLHRPHPQKEIARYTVRDLRKYLASLGMTP